jgi:hypothetical protein
MMKRFLLCLRFSILVLFAVGCAPPPVMPRVAAPAPALSPVGKDSASQIQALKEFRVRLISEMQVGEGAPYDFRNYAQAAKYASEAIALMTNEP